MHNKEENASSCYKGTIPYLVHILKERVGPRTSGSKSRAGIGAESLYIFHTHPPHVPTPE